MAVSLSQARLLRFMAVLWLLGAWTALPVLAQQRPADKDAEEERLADTYGTGAGFEILLTNNGFGLGGYYAHRVTGTTSLLLTASLGAGKDDRELKFFSRFGSGFIPNKRNYFLMLPAHLGVQQRLFSEAIEDNFRPYLQVSFGPTLGWEYPYFEDVNNNERYDEDIEQRFDALSAFPNGAARFGLGGTLALGAHFGLSRKVTQGVRFGYALNYFFDGIQLLEPDIKPAQHLFHTPVISITFGRLF